MFEPPFFDISNVKQILTMIARIKLLWKSYLVCYDINKKYGIRQASFISVFEVFCNNSNMGMDSFSHRMFYV